MQKIYFEKANKIFKKGIYIVFEGGDKVGKDTQIRLLKKSLKKELIKNKIDKKIITTFEPGSTKEGQKIRTILLSKKFDKINPLAELFLFTADRRIHFDKIIIPHLKKGDIIISSRSFFSSWAYQGYARGINKKYSCFIPKDFYDYITYLNYFATFVKNKKTINKENSELYKDNIGILPDICFYLDLDPKISIKRMKKRDRIEREDIRFMEKIREGYLKLKDQYKDIIKIINANRTIEEIHKDILEVIKKNFDYFK